MQTLRKHLPTKALEWGVCDAYASEQILKRVGGEQPIDALHALDLEIPMGDRLWFAFRPEMLGDETVKFIIAKALEPIEPAIQKLEKRSDRMKAILDMIESARKEEKYDGILGMVAILYRIVGLSETVEDALRLLADMIRESTKGFSRA